MLASRDMSREVAAKIDTEVSLPAEDKQPHPEATTRKSSQRRFTDEQIRFLESMYKTEPRPELQIKHQLADKLGLHPRQVAIWFQNKRARSKSKLMERDYKMLKNSYDKLASKLDLLKEENQSLLLQLKRLKNLTRKQDGDIYHVVPEARKSNDEDLHKKEINSGAEEKPNYLTESHNNKHQIFIPEDTSQYTERFGEETEFLNIQGLVPDDSLASSSNGVVFSLALFWTTHFVVCHIGGTIKPIRE
ncbi:hypothetical protein NMG60_11026848 [Bertholletia excelsa]